MLDRLAQERTLGGVLERLRTLAGGYELRAHWQQGEFHHDLIVRVLGTPAPLPGAWLVIATNCNGGVKELVCFGELPERSALWHWRCPTMPEFAGDVPPVLARAVTEHWFDPCELLGPDARSEIRPEFRQRQAGGGWELTPGTCGVKKP